MPSFRTPSLLAEANVQSGASVVGYGAKVVTPFL